MVRAFYQETSNKLIIVPYRCGSTHLLHNIAKYDLLFLDLKKKKEIEIFLDIKKNCTEKNFIWRNPLERLVSFYNAFIFSKNTNAKLQQKIFAPKNSSKNFWCDLNYEFHLIEKNFSEDVHTTRQSLYFEKYEEDISNYKIFDVKDYTKYIMLNFADKIENTSDTYEKISSTTTIKMSDVINMLEVKAKVEKLYYEDYILGNYVQRL